MKNQEPTQAKRPDFAEIARRSFELYEGRARIDTIAVDDSPPADDDAADGEESDFAAPVVSDKEVSAA